MTVLSSGWQDVIMGIALLSVAGILFWGVITMGRGGAYNKSKSNTIMRYRIVVQVQSVRKVFINFVQDYCF